jgi:hypothetical protein
MILLCDGLHFAISIKTVRGPHKTDRWATSGTPAHLNTYFLPCGDTCALELWWFHLKVTLSVRQHFVCNEHKVCSRSSPKKVINRQIKRLHLPRNLPVPGYDIIRKQHVAVLLKPCGHKDQCYHYCDFIYSLQNYTTVTLKDTVHQCYFCMVCDAVSGGGLHLLRNGNVGSQNQRKENQLHHS